MHSPEHVCEALAWLYGVEFKARQGLKMLGFHTEYSGRFAMKGLHNG